MNFRHLFSCDTTEENIFDDDEEDTIKVRTVKTIMVY